jgi:hypothetical protein
MFSLARLSLFLALLSITSCTKFKPVIQENYNFKNFSKARIEYEIDICIDEADDLISNQIKTESYYEASDSFVKGVGNSISQAIIGNGNPTSTLSSSAIRSTAIGTNSAIKSYAPNKQNPRIAKQNLITKCLAQKGLTVIGWK